jgi:hypothetical protein
MAFRGVEDRDEVAHKARILLEDSPIYHFYLF